MTTGEMGTPTKAIKTSTSQEQTSTSTPLIFPEWATPLQAFYNPGTTSVPPGCFHSVAASSPQAKPYMWGPQPLMPPYPSPHPPYVAMFSPGAVYAQQPMPVGTHLFGTYGMSSAGVSVEVTSGAESSKSKDQIALKSSKGNIMPTGKVDESGKQVAPLTNGIFSQSGESGTERSSEGSDDNSHNGSQSGQKMHFYQDSLEAQNGHSISQTINKHAATGVQAGETKYSSTMATVVVSLSATSGMVAGPMTNSNIGMDHWRGSTAPTYATTHRRCPISSPTTEIVPAAQNMAVMGSCDTAAQELWLQDERELKKQRRKQSNRESARRSRLRKQAECEELARRVETLTSENMALRTDLAHLQADSEKLRSENTYLAEQLKNFQSKGSGENGAKLQNLDGEPCEWLNNIAVENTTEPIQRDDGQ